MQKGWKSSTTMTKLRNAVEYAYGRNFLVEWEKRMQWFIRMQDSAGSQPR